MSTKKNVLNQSVSDFLDDLNHPLRAEIDLLRRIVLDANTELSENIKWNGPNYVFNDNDRITLKIQPPKVLNLIFHTGAKKQALPKTRLISSTSSLLQWKDNSRAVLTFKTLAEIKAAKTEIAEIVVAWLNAAK